MKIWQNVCSRMLVVLILLVVCVGMLGCACGPKDWEKEHGKIVIVKHTQAVEKWPVSYEKDLGKVEQQLKGVRQNQEAENRKMYIPDSNLSIPDSSVVNVHK